MELQWPLILFTTLVAWAAGVFGAQGALALKGAAKKSQLPLTIVSVALLAASGIAVFFHLEHWERIFNGFGHITSGITQELIAIVVFGIVAVIYFIMLRKSDNGSVPKWVAICAIVIAVILSVVCAHSYTMAARPAWDSILEIASVVGASLLLGPATCGIVMALRGDLGSTCQTDEQSADETSSPTCEPEPSIAKETNLSSKQSDASILGILTLICAVVGAICVVVYAAFLQSSGGSFFDVGYYFDGTHPTSGMVNVSSTISEQAGLLWVGAVIVGALIPAISAFLARCKADAKSWKIWGIVIVIAALIGAICLRVAFYNLGISVFMYY